MSIKKITLILLPFLLISLVVYFKNGPSQSSHILAQVSSDSWPQLQRDANHSGYSSQTVGPPYTEICRRQDFPVSTRVQPIIAENLVFLPSNNNRLYAISSSNCQTVWTYQTEGPLVNAAAYDSGKVFFGSFDNYVYAVNTGNGSLAWRYETGGSIHAAPVIADGKVFIGSSDGYLYAINTNNGSLAWRYQVGVPVYDTPAYDSGRIFFCGMDSKAYGINATNGTLAWSRQLLGQGCRDRWTVAGHGKVFVTPILSSHYHVALAQGTQLFNAGANPVIYNQPWSVQRDVILNYLAGNPYVQPMYVLDQATGQISFTPPILYQGGSTFPHSQVVLLPNGNANVIYRHSDGVASLWGQTTNEALYVGELNLTTGDITSVDRCIKGTGGWEDCGNYKSPMISDEGALLTRSGDIIYLDISKGTVGLDTRNEALVQTMVAYNIASTPFSNAAVRFDDYLGGEWRAFFPGAERDDGNSNHKKPVPLVGDRFFILHHSTLVIIRGTTR